MVLGLFNFLNPFKVCDFNNALTAVFCSGVALHSGEGSLDDPQRTCLCVSDLVKQCLFFMRYKDSTSYYISTLSLGSMDVGHSAIMLYDRYNRVNASVVKADQQMRGTQCGDCRRNIPAQEYSDKKSMFIQWLFWRQLHNAGTGQANTFHSLSEYIADC